MAHTANPNKSDPVRDVLANLIAETEAPYTPNSILREFRAIDDKRLTDRELLFLLESISCKRPNCREVLDEIKYTLRRKDPMYALLVFAERMSDDPLWSQNCASTLSSEMPPPNGRTVQAQSLHEQVGSSNTNSLTHDRNCSHSNGSCSRKSLDLSTSTPLTSRKVDEIPGPNTAPPAHLSPALLAMRPANLYIPIAPRGDLSGIKKRVLNAVSHSDLLTSMETFSSSTASSARTPTGNGSSSSSSTALNTKLATALTTAECTGLVPCNLGTQKSMSSSSGLNNQNLAICDGQSERYRNHLLWNFCVVDGQKPLPKQEVAALPLDSQERVLLTDLIYCMSGVRGSYIVPLQYDAQGYPSGMTKYETRFAVNMQLDRSLSEIVNDILPLASYFIGIQKVIAETDGLGQVNNALNASLQCVSHDFYLLLSQTEIELQKNNLSVPKLLYYLQPTIWVMEEIWTVLVELQVNEFQGAALLSHLCARIKRLEGDKSAQSLIITLATKAAEPYMRMLQTWIQKGVIVDSSQEFLVEDNEDINKNEMPEHYSDDYWERRYTVRTDCIPTFLENHADKILRTGKYLNVIRQCGKRVMPTQSMDLQFDPMNEHYVYVINDAYYFAARMLLDVLLTENDLMGHLQSVKRYLLLNQGDFIMQFMDACEDELSKNVDHVLPMTLENLLGLTLRLSSARNDPYKDDLHCELLTYDLVTQMSKIMNQTEEYWKVTDRLDLSGLECFAFSYEVKWPVSLVLNHIAISKYQMLFRQLFYCKHVERQLCKIWKENSIAKKFSPQAAELYRSAFTLRQRMMNAIQNLEYYMMIEIIEPSWHIFIEKMKNVENVDMVLHLHHDFLDICLKNCMLTETSHLNRAIFKLCKICLKFCEFIQRSQRIFLDAELKSMVCDTSEENTDQSDTETELSDRLQSETLLDQTDTFSERVKRFDLEFTGMLISFLKQINDLSKDNTSDRFINLMHRINFNGFYSDQMEKMCVKDAMG